MDPTHNSQMMSRHEFWRRSYDQNRYMRMLSRKELTQRFEDLVLNTILLTSGGAISILPVRGPTENWWIKFTHVLEEMQLRNAPYPAWFRDKEAGRRARERAPNFASELAAKAASALTRYNLQRGDVFIKFGKRAHMEALYQGGELRVQAASYFSDKSHNAAVQDDELSLDFSFALSRDDIVRLVVNPQDVRPNTPGGRLDIGLRTPTDYWLYCVTNSVEPRLFVDFDADACVIIKDKAAFRALLGAAARCDSTLTATSMREGDALYVDPLLPDKEVVSLDMFIPLAKHYRYTYQDEFRFCWTPSAPSHGLTHVDLRLGSLTAIAELITL